MSVEGGFSSRHGITIATEVSRRLSAPFPRVISANFGNDLQCLKDCLLTRLGLKGDQSKEDGLFLRTRR